MKRIYSAKTLLSLGLLLAPVCLFAQSGWHHNNPGMDVPLDGGLSLLAAAGIGYSIKKYAAKKKAGSMKK